MSSSLLAPSLAVTLRVTVLLIAPSSWVLGGFDAPEVSSLGLRGLVVGGLVLGGIVLGGLVLGVVELGGVEPPDPPEIFFLTGLLPLS